MLLFANGIVYMPMWVYVVLVIVVMYTGINIGKKMEIHKQKKKN